MPMVVVYRLHPLTYLLARLLVSVERIALPNLVLGREVVPELIQGECTAPRIAAALGALLDSPGETAKVRASLAEIPARLGGSGAFDRAARAVLHEAEGA
jgi:lipid-A-disaccharide synthase